MNTISSEKNLYGTVSNIQRFTVHDGPGIRTELFMKGCSLRCEWCSNPETYKGVQEIGVNSKKCICCGYCLKACEANGKNAIIITESGVVGIDREKCDNCLLCEKECYSGCLFLYGKKMTPEEALNVVRRDRDFYEESGGGITISGGECLLQWEFCRELLRLCKEDGIGTCVETALYVKSEAIEQVAPYTDLFITDIKQMDTDIHKKYTGVDNELILRNIKKIVDMNKPLIIRIPIIPGFNDNEEFIDRASDFILNELDNKPLQIQFLKYRPLGEEKAKMLGMPMQMKAMKIEDRESFELQIRGYVKRMNEKGILATAGSREKIALDK